MNHIIPRALVRSALFVAVLLILAACGGPTSSQTAAPPAAKAPAAAPTTAPAAPTAVPPTVAPAPTAVPPTAAPKATDAPKAAAPAATSAGTTACRTIKHDAGETNVCGIADRVAVIGTHMLDILLALGLQPTGLADVDVALTGPNTAGQPAPKVKYIGDRITSNPISIGTRNAPSLEAISALKPTLILGELGLQAEQYTLLSQIAPTILFSGSKRDEWMRSIPAIAQAIGYPERADQVITAHKQRVEAAKTEMTTLLAGQKLLLLSSNALAYSIADDTGYPGGVMADIGMPLINKRDLGTLINAADTNVSVEILPQIKTDVIIVMAAGMDTPEVARENWNKNAVLAALPASQAKRVYFVDYQLWSRIRGPIASELIIAETRQLLKK